MTERIHMFVRATGRPSETQDALIPGTYRVEVDADLALGDRASAALDGFHQAMAVGTLDDFSFDVLDAAGNPVFEGDSEAYALSDRACLLSKVDDADVPEPPIPISRGPGN